MSTFHRIVSALIVLSFSASVCLGQEAGGTGNQQAPAEPAPGWTPPPQFEDNRALLARGKQDEAVKPLRKATSLYPRFAEAWFALGTV